MNIKEIKYSGNNISFDGNGNVNAIANGNFVVVFDCEKYNLENVHFCVDDKNNIKIPKEIIAKGITDKWSVKDLLKILKTVDEFNGEIKQYEEDVVSPFYMEDIDAYDNIEKYYKGVWNNTFYQGGASYGKLIKFIMNNLDLFKR